MRCCAFVAAGVIALLIEALCPIEMGPASATVFKTNPIIAVDRAVETQFAPMGELESLGVERDKNGEAIQWFGTGFLVSPCYIITNHHVVFGNSLSAVPGKDYSMKFHVGVGPDGTGFFGETVATLVVWGEREKNGRNDWALLKLKTCVGAPKFNVGWFEVALRSSDQLVGTSVAAVGFATDDRRGILSASLGKVFEPVSNSGLLKTSAALRDGQSGGGVFQFDRGRMSLVGIATMSLGEKSHPLGDIPDAYSSDRANEFLNIAPILNRPEVRTLLDADRALVGNVNAASNRFSRPFPVSIR